MLHSQSSSAQTAPRPRAGFGVWLHTAAPKSGPATRAWLAAGFVAAAALLTACVEPAATPPASPPASQPTSDIEPVTGISKSALVAVQGMPDLGGETVYGVFYLVDRIDRLQLAAAPDTLCRNRGGRLISAEDKALEHPSQMPGTRKLVVRCK